MHRLLLTLAMGPGIRHWRTERVALSRGRRLGRLPEPGPEPPAELRTTQLRTAGLRCWRPRPGLPPGRRRRIPRPGLWPGAAGTVWLVQPAAGPSPRPPAVEPAEPVQPAPAPAEPVGWWWRMEPEPEPGPAAGRPRRRLRPLVSMTARVRCWRSHERSMSEVFPRRLRRAIYMPC